MELHQRQGSLPHRPHSDSSLIGSPPMNQRGLRGLDLAQRIPQLRRGILSPVKSVRVPDGVVVTASTAVSREYAVYLASVRASRKPAPPPVSITQTHICSPCTRVGRLQAPARWSHAQACSNASSWIATPAFRSAYFQARRHKPSGAVTVLVVFVKDAPR